MPDCPPAWPSGWRTRVNCNPPRLAPGRRSPKLIGELSTLSPFPLQLFIDPHCHPRFSADGVAEPEALIKEARAKGLHGFAITDHNTCACVNYFLQHGFMNKEGLPVDGLLIIPGQEITTAEGHLLALGVSLPDLKGIPAIEAVALIHQAGGLAIPPHPYDFFRAGI